MPNTFEFELDERVQAVVEGRICGRQESTDRGKQYTVVTRSASGRPVYRTFSEDELDEPGDEPELDTAKVIPLTRAA